MARVEIGGCVEVSIQAVYIVLDALSICIAKYHAIRPELQGWEHEGFAPPTVIQNFAIFMIGVEGVPQFMADPLLEIKRRNGGSSRLCIRDTSNASE